MEYATSNQVLWHVCGYGSEGVCKCHGMVKWHGWESHRSSMTCVLIAGGLGELTDEKVFKSEGGVSESRSFPTSEPESDCLLVSWRDHFPPRPGYTGMVHPC